MAQSATPQESHNGGASGVAESLDHFRSEFREIDKEVRGFVHERPLLALGLAVAAGYLVGRLLSKL